MAIRRIKDRTDRSGKVEFVIENRPMGNAVGAINKVFGRCLGGYLAGWCRQLARGVGKRTGRERSDVGKARSRTGRQAEARSVRAKIFMKVNTRKRQLTMAGADKLNGDASAGELFFSEGDGTGAHSESQIRRRVSWSKQQEQVEDAEAARDWQKRVRARAIER